MWKLLIAEDELEIRDGLCNYVNWVNLDIELVKAADNGKDALEYLLCNDVDIVLTDIVMPYMDGIDLIRSIQKHEISVIPVIISVHWDKEYLKSAFKLEVMDYILKPVNLDELYDVMKKVVKKCEKARNYNNIKLNLEKRLKDMEPVLKERLLYKLISGTIFEEDALIKQIQQVKLKINPMDKCIFVTLHSFDKNEVELDEGDMLNLIIEDIIKNIEMDMQAVVVALNNNKTGLILIGSCSANYEYVEGIMHILSKKLLDVGITIIVGIGQSQDGISEISFSRKQAEKALDYSTFFVHNDIFLYNDMVNIGMKQVYPESLIINTVNKANLGDIDGVSEAVDAIFEKLISRYKNDEITIKQICFDLTNRLMDVVEAERPTTSQEILISINHLKNISKLKDFVKNYCMIIAEAQYKLNNDRCNTLVDEILKFIDDNYSKHITLKLLADKYFFSPNYISTLFKRYKGVPFSQHLTNVRIENAKQLMKNANMKLYDISKTVGYEDADYFSKKFKQVTGASPSIWRSKANH